MGLRVAAFASPRSARPAPRHAHRAGCGCRSRVAAAIDDHLGLLRLCPGAAATAGPAAAAGAHRQSRASVSVLWWLHDRHWKQSNHPEALGSRHGRRRALATDPWPLADHTKRVSGSLALHNSTRDEPVNLSGSRLRTHQHWSPAGATKEYGSSWIFEPRLTCANALQRVQHPAFALGNCCQSLLLDPDATIGIDLHKWLFLLVSGRGE
jgi:hypothetical protein